MVKETQLMNGIPLVDLSLQHAEIEAEVMPEIAAVAARGAFIQGPDVVEFEREFAQYCGVAHCVGVANGTDAIELALRAVGVGPDDEVILPANTFVATAGAVKRCGATPVLVDCDDSYLLINPALIEAQITDRTRAIVPVHLYGQIAPMEAIGEIAARHGVHVIEDAAQAQGAERLGQRAGSFGVAAGTSFYPGKNLGAYGDAGAVMLDDDEMARRVRRLGNHGSDTKYRHPELGFNSRLDTIQAIVLRAKLRRLDAWNAQRRAAASLYDQLLADVPGVSTPSVLPGNVPVWHLYVVRLTRRDEVLAELNAAGIGAGIHYPTPIHLHGAYADLGHGVGDFPVAENSARQIMSLPIYPGITPAQQERVVAVLADAVSRAA
jgi:dTDP-4-amino-4,6-dideoxygalactose transaminase